MSKLTTSAKINVEEKQHSFRLVSRIINSIKTMEGGGFIVHRPFPTNALLDFDLSVSQHFVHKYVIGSIAFFDSVFSIFPINSIFLRRIKN
jgi:hypothetical protein